MSRLAVLYLGSLVFRSLCVGVLAVAATLCFRSVTKRHAIWLAVLLIMFLMPAVDTILPLSLVPIPLQRIVAEPSPVTYLFDGGSLSPSPAVLPPAALPKAFATRIDWWMLALVLYGCTAVTLLFRLALGYRALSKLKTASRRITTPVLNALWARNAPALYESDLVCVPLTGGFTRPFVLVPAGWRTWDEWKLNAVLVHELTHIRRRDGAVTAIAAVNACIFWFNPLAWWLQRQLTFLAEKASDEASVLLTGNAARYAEVLLQFVTAAQGGQRLRIGGVAMAAGNMRSRIDRVLTIRHPESGVLTKASCTVLLAVAMSVLYTAAAMHVTQGSAAALQSPPLGIGAANLSWIERVSSTITVEERAVYQRLQTDEERHHFTEQFWARRFGSWPNEVAYIIRDEERAVYQQLRTEEERGHFVEQFWARMDPTPGTSDNEFRNEYYGRLEYASQTLVGASGPSWWKTDRGRTYIVYGRPDETAFYPAGGIHIYAGGTQTIAYPFEHWRYGRIEGLGDNVIFDFADSNGTGDFLLTSRQARPIGSITSDSNTIEDVGIRGNRRIPSDAIASNLRTKRGEPFNQATIRRDIDALYALGYFDEIQVDVTGSANGGRIIVFHLKEKP